MIRRILLTLPLAVALSLAGPTGQGAAPAAAQACLSDNEARAVVSSGQASPFQNFYGAVTAQAGDVQGIPDLCNLGGQWVYKVKVLAGGKVTTVYVNAANGAINY